MSAQTDSTRRRTPQMTQDEAIASIGNYNYGWHDADTAGAVATRGLSEAKSSATSPRSRTSPSGCSRLRLKALRLFDKKPMPLVGLGPVGHRLRQHQVLRAVHGEAGHSAGRTCPRTSRTPTTAWASPRPRSSASSPASPRSTSPRWSTTRSSESLEEQGVIFLDTDTAPARAPGDLRGVLRLGHPGRRQQVRRR